LPIISRKQPYYALCGLNCCLCPRFNIDGKSKCPGCGGPGFVDKHPACAVMACSIKHNNVEYCFECSEYPCKKYEKNSEKDSFASYAQVIENLNEAKRNLTGYIKELKEKYKYLRILIENYNDGRSNKFYCTVINNIPYDNIKEIMTKIWKDKELEKMDVKIKCKEVVKMIKEKAEELGIGWELRK
jgi:hypothetical protein